MADPQQALFTELENAWKQHFQGAHEAHETEKDSKRILLSARPLDPRWTMPETFDAESSKVYDGVNLILEPILRKHAAIIERSHFEVYPKGHAAVHVWLNERCRKNV